MYKVIDGENRIFCDACEKDITKKYVHMLGEKLCEDCYNEEYEDEEGIIANEQ